MLSMLDPSTCDNVPFYYDVQVLASKLLQACLCSEGPPSDYNSTLDLLICVWFINAIQVHVTIDIEEREGLKTEVVHVMILH